ncbi:MAG: hypothetical protein O7F73_19110 [Gammaproteobacteria bacterium]|nr:hypothetical protein [Gammaproteobacteria bacterium]
MRSSTRYTVIFFSVLLVIYLLLLDTLAKPLFESQASEMYGAEVTLDSVQISPFVGKITLFQLQVADRSNANRNLVQADRVYIDIKLLRLASDIIEIEQLETEGLVVFADRPTPAKILRPLVAEDSDIATAGLPDFKLPDIDALLARQRDKLDADIAALNAAFDEGEAKWKAKIATLPSAEDIEEYQRRLTQLKNPSGGVAGKLAAVASAQEVYSDVRRDLANLESMRREFRGDIAQMRETISDAAGLPGKHTNELISSLGLDSAQTAQLGNQLLRGDLNGILQQVLAPIAYSTAGQISPEDTMPIFIAKASLKGPLLPSAAGLAVVGELTNFSWPLEIAEEVAILKLRGSSLDGGSLAVDAHVDHRGVANDLVTIAVDQLPLRDMLLAGDEELHITLLQTLLNITGELRVQGEQLDGMVRQNYTKTVLQIELPENASKAARLLAAVLESSNDFVMQMVFSGTVQSPQISFAADLDELLQKTVLSALQSEIGELTTGLQNRISSEIGPQIAAAREQFASLEALEKSLQKNLNNLNSLSN